MTTSPFPDALPGAEVCFAVASSLLYVEPSLEAVADSVAVDQFASAPYGDGNARVVEGLALMERWCSAVREAVAAERGDVPAEVTAAVLVASPVFAEAVAALRREWLRLFAGAGAPEASCLESFYVEPNSHMFGQCTLAVRAIYRRHGLQLENLRREPDDHLGLMLGFVAHLIGEELDALAVGDEAAAAGAVREQEHFLADHVLPWLASWRYAVERRGTSDYFRGAGDFVFGLTACYAERFGIVFDEATQTFKRRK